MKPCWAQQAFTTGSNVFPLIYISYKEYTQWPTGHPQDISTPYSWHRRPQLLFLLSFESLPSPRRPEQKQQWDITEGASENTRYFRRLSNEVGCTSFSAKRSARRMSDSHPYVFLPRSPHSQMGGFKKRKDANISHYRMQAFNSCSRNRGRDKGSIVVHCPVNEGN